MAYIPKFIAIIFIAFMIGCQSSSVVERHELTSSGTKGRIDMTYPYLDLVKIQVKTPSYHSEKLMEANTAEDAAYHIIALGLLGQNTSNVRDALCQASIRFGASGLPQRYDWPDSAEEFKQKLKNEPDCIVDHYPGNRAVSMQFLIDECIHRLGLSNIDCSSLKSRN